MDIKALYLAIKKLPDAELRNVMKSAELELLHRGESRREALRKKLGAMAAREGLSLDDLVGSKTVKTVPKAQRGPAGAKTVLKKSSKKAAVGKVAKSAVSASGVIFRNPADKSMTWSGKGRRPGWVTAHLEAGGDIAQLRGRVRR